jgi:hypothetical protein
MASPKHTRLSTIHHFLPSHELYPYTSHGHTTHSALFSPSSSQLTGFIGCASRFDRNLHKHRKIAFIQCRPSRKLGQIAPLGSYPHVGRLDLILPVDVQFSYRAPQEQLQRGYVSSLPPESANQKSSEDSSNCFSSAPDQLRPVEFSMREIHRDSGLNDEHRNSKHETPV